MITLTVNKQKDAEECKPIKVRLKVVELGDEDGKTLTSCVVVGADERLDATTNEPDLSPALRQAVLALAAFDSGGASSAVWREAIEDAGGKAVKERTFHNWRMALIEKQLVEQVSEANRPRYRLTEGGRAVANGMPSSCHGTGPVLVPCHATTL